MELCRGAAHVPSYLRLGARYICGGYRQDKAQIQKREQTVRGGRVRPTFRARGAMFEADGTEVCIPFEVESAEAISTVKGNEAQFTKREVRDARQAREMMRRLGFVSMKDQAAMLKYGAIINCPVTPADSTERSESTAQISPP